MNNSYLRSSIELKWDWWGLPPIERKDPTEIPPGKGRDIGEFKRISIPLVRRIYPQLIANKIVSTQPLLGPTGLAYYLRFRYSSNKASECQLV